MTVGIRVLDAAQAEVRLPHLAAILMDAVAGGASVNFMAELSLQEAMDFWRNQLPGIAHREKYLLIAECGDQLVGTVMLTLAHQPNAPHRADIGKMLVLSTARRRGIGAQLLAAAEAEALKAGRTLLLLDTESGSAGELLYRSRGWQEVGRVPGHSYTPDGNLASATIFAKTLGPHRRSAAP